MINRNKFFDGVRPLFGRVMTQEQVVGMTAVLDAWDRRDIPDVRWPAYMLATEFHETDKTMQAIKEYGRGKGRKYGVPVNGQVYYGRGLVQLTWQDNYDKMGKIVGVDLLHNPDLALSLPVAVQIMFEGMIRGSFTGKKLADYFNPKIEDPVNARRIINGTDRAQLIAGYYKVFKAALA